MSRLSFLVTAILAAATGLGGVAQAQAPTITRCDTSPDPEDHCIDFSGAFQGVTTLTAGATFSPVVNFQLPVGTYDSIVIEWETPARIRGASPVTSAGWMFSGTQIDDDPWHVATQISATNLVIEPPEGSPSSTLRVDLHAVSFQLQPWAWADGETFDILIRMTATQGAITWVDTQTQRITVTATSDLEVVAFRQGGSVARVADAGAPGGYREGRTFVTCALAQTNGQVKVSDVQLTVDLPAHATYVRSYPVNRNSQEVSWVGSQLSLDVQPTPLSQGGNVTVTQLADLGRSYGLYPDSWSLAPQDYYSNVSQVVCVEYLVECSDLGATYPAPVELIHIEADGDALGAPVNDETDVASERAQGLETTACSEIGDTPRPAKTSSCDYDQPPGNPPCVLGPGDRSGWRINLRPPNGVFELPHTTVYDAVPPYQEIDRIGAAQPHLNGGSLLDTDTPPGLSAVDDTATWTAYYCRFDATYFTTTEPVASDPLLGGEIGAYTRRFNLDPADFDPSVAPFLPVWIGSPPTAELASGCVTHDKIWNRTSGTGNYDPPAPTESLKVGDINLIVFTTKGNGRDGWNAAPDPQSGVVLGTPPALDYYYLMRTLELTPSPDIPSVVLNDDPVAANIANIANVQATGGTEAEYDDWVRVSDASHAVTSCVAWGPSFVNGYDSVATQDEVIGITLSVSRHGATPRNQTWTMDLPPGWSFTQNPQPMIMAAGYAHFDRAGNTGVLAVSQIHQWATIPAYLFSPAVAPSDFAFIWSTVAGRQRVTVTLTGTPSIASEMLGAESSVFLWVTPDVGYPHVNLEPEPVRTSVNAANHTLSVTGGAINETGCNLQVLVPASLEGGLEPACIAGTTDPAVDLVFSNSGGTNLYGGRAIMRLPAGMTFDSMELVGHPPAATPALATTDDANPFTADDSAWTPYLGGPVASVTAVRLRYPDTGPAGLVPAYDVSTRLRVRLNTSLGLGIAATGTFSIGSYELNMSPERLGTPVIVGTCPATLILNKFHDVNGNNAADPGEPPLADWDLKAEIFTRGAAVHDRITYPAVVRGLTDGSGRTLALEVYPGESLSFSETIPAPAANGGGLISWAPTLTPTGLTVPMTDAPIERAFGNTCSCTDPIDGSPSSDNLCTTNACDAGGVCAFEELLLACDGFPTAECTLATGLCDPATGECGFNDQPCFGDAGVTETLIIQCAKNAGGAIVGEFHCFYNHAAQTIRCDNTNGELTRYDAGPSCSP